MNKRRVARDLVQLAKNLTAYKGTKTYLSKGDGEFHIQIRGHVRATLGRSRTVKGIIDTEEDIKKVAMSEVKGLSPEAKDIYWAKTALVIPKEGLYVILNGIVEFADENSGEEILRDRGYEKTGPLKG